MSSPPPEPPGGQEPEPPDVGLALLVAVRLLRDYRDHTNTGAGDARDLDLRARAVIGLLVRLRERYA